MLPRDYNLTVRHNMGADVTVTVKGHTFRLDGSTGNRINTSETWINAQTVSDATDVASADKDGSTEYGMHGLLQVTAPASRTGTITLYLVTKEGTDYSDSLLSRPLRSIEFVAETGTKEASFAA